MDAPEATNKNLAIEYGEHNNYIRTFITIGVTWYTFFVTSNLVVMGLFLSKMLEGVTFSYSYFLLASCLFVFVNVFVNVLGIFACGVFARQFAKTEKRLLFITGLLNKASGDSQIESPFSLSTVKGSIKLVVWSLVGLAVFWVAVPVLFLVVNKG